MGGRGAVIFHGKDYSNHRLPASPSLPLLATFPSRSFLYGPTVPVPTERSPEEVRESILGKQCGRDLPIWGSQTGFHCGSL